MEATMRRTFEAVVGILILAGGSAALAHHSYGSFFLDRTASIEGDIHQLRFVNPHVVIQIRTADSSIYTATWGPADQVERSGVTKTTLKIGDHVIVSGAPPRDPASHELMPVWEIRRPSDGWAWKHSRGPARVASN
jgi:hypothetical protein